MLGFFVGEEDGCEVGVVLGCDVGEFVIAETLMLLEISSDKPTHKIHGLHNIV
jgi:hypothetical protein